MNLTCAACLCQSLFVFGQGSDLSIPPVSNNSKRAQVLIVHDPLAVLAFDPQASRIQDLVDRAITRFTGHPSPATAWASLVSTQDVIGLKVVSTPGRLSGTRPEVVAAVVKGLLAAGVPSGQIIIWDKHLADLRAAGFVELAGRLGVRAAGSAAAGYDQTHAAYEVALLGQLVYGDLEFGKEGQGVGRKSYVSKLLTRELTRIINITPLLNHNAAGVSGNLWSLAMASVDNTLRFEDDRARLATAVPDIYALPGLGDRVALNIVDALIGQYEGERRGLLHYSVTLNELRFSLDPVALDVLSLFELSRHRQNERAAAAVTNYLELYQNASLLELGVSDRRNIRIESLSATGENAHLEIRGRRGPQSPLSGASGSTAPRR